MDAPARHTFSRDERLKSRGDFRRCIKRGARAAGKAIVVRVARNGLTVTRLGAGSTRRLGNAVERNRQKRLVREAFRLTKHQLPAGLDIVALPKVPWPGPTLEELEADLVDTVQKAADKLPRTEQP
ncbi:MAG: ribonuclease P protein component [Planctomycetota bacterium]